jgi:acyl carrier protein
VSTSDIDERLTACFLSVFPFLDASDIPKLSKATNDAWDSLASVSLVTVLEEEFDVMFDDDTIDRLVSFDATREAVLANAS